jgi:hypothetical protein
MLQITVKIMQEAMNAKPKGWTGQFYPGAVEAWVEFLEEHEGLEETILWPEDVDYKTDA